MAGTASVVAHLGTHTAVVQAALERASLDQIVPRLWARDHTLWKSDPAEIANRLGWLTLVEGPTLNPSVLEDIQSLVAREGYRDIVLLGMGGSSLGPEVLRLTFGSAKGAPRLWVLDTTVPGAIRTVTRAIPPANTLFLVASKSGGTIEVLSLLAHFKTLVHNAKGNRGGGQFVAITDPGTSLVTLAKQEGFARTVLNPPDIGGRYSVLSYFGLVPAALIGIDTARLMERAATMGRACREEARLDQNPGAALGVILGSLARQGRNKVTILTSPRLSSYGLWAEQLLAESTGKEGTGLIPIADEPALAAAAYGNDRVFVALRLKGDVNSDLDKQVRTLIKAGHPLVELSLADRYDLGAEFFRWEFATAIAGHLLNIHPFDQPNVQESKENTGRILAGIKTTGALPAVTATDPRRAARQLLGHHGLGSYLGILAYMPPSRGSDLAIRRLRRILATQTRVATTAGYGPRYLHSTGQVHKGGPPTGLFLLLMETPKPDLPIPGQPYTFGMLAQAQAIGDLQSLQAHGRPVVHVRLGTDPLHTLRLLSASASASPPTRGARRAPRTRAGRAGPAGRRRPK